MNCEVEEKRKMDAIYQAFRSYVDGHYYFDILYSDKIGYVRLFVDETQEEEAVRLRSTEQMLHTLFYEIILDVVLSSDRKRLSDEAEAEIRRRITEILRNLGEFKDEMIACMDSYLKDNVWSR